MLQKLLLSECCAWDVAILGEAAQLIDIVVWTGRLRTREKTLQLYKQTIQEAHKKMSIFWFYITYSYFIHDWNIFLIVHDTFRWIFCGPNSHQNINWNKSDEQA